MIDSKQQKEILNGTFQPPTNNTETLEWFKSLRSKLTPEERKIDLTIKKEVFFDFCRWIEEQKSSSLSGRHCGHY